MIFPVLAGSGDLVVDLADLINGGRDPIEVICDLVFIVKCDWLKVIG